MEWSSGRFSVFLVFFPFHLISSSPLRRKTEPRAARSHTDVSSGMICCGRKKRFPSESWEIQECWRACGGATWMQDRPSSQSNRTDFSASRTSSLTINNSNEEGATSKLTTVLADLQNCWEDRRSLDLKKKKRAADCLWKIQLTWHMMVFSLLHIGIFKVKVYARNKYPHTLSTWTTEQISHLQTVCFCVRLFKIVTSVLYDCKHWKKILFLALKHTQALHSVFKFH